MFPVSQFTRYTPVITFCLGLPTAVATYYQAWKARQEASQARAGLIYSKNCLEFVLADGTAVNVVPLETLHTLPKPGDIVLLPGSGIGQASGISMGAFRVGRIEHIYGHMEGRKHDPKQARLIKAVAHVEGLVGGVDFANEDVVSVTD
jgi:hypothetical protein